MEVRKAWSIAGSEVIPFLRGAENWKKFKSVIKVKSERYVGEQLSSTKVRYFIASLSSDAQLALKAIRSHWGDREFIALGTGCHIWRR